MAALKVEKLVVLTAVE
jgi:hypothetical protein